MARVLYKGRVCVVKEAAGRLKVKAMTSDDSLSISEGPYVSQYNKKERWIGEEETAELVE